MTTTLILVRHGQPEDPGREYPDERLRPLTTAGRVIQERMTLHLQERGYQWDLIYSSPVLRARQTAMIIAQHSGASTEVTPALDYALDTDTLLRLLPAPSTGGSLLFVGHNPSIAQFGNALIGEPFFDGGMEQSGAFIVQFHDLVELSLGELVEYISPGS